MSESNSRRDFIRQSATSSAALMVGGYLATAKGYAQNETINIGCIGTGGRCRHLMGNLNKIPGVKLVAVCDVWDATLNAGLKLSDENAFSTKYYEELLARDDIDAVVIGTSDHWHVPITIDACHAGKDVYVEKPLTHSIEEGAAVIKAQKETGRVVQVVMQQRSMPHLIEAKRALDTGELGDVSKV
ncbi:MAG: Gfo/Idh/MocA family oxidoreductase, partial [Candidatus Hydrogenedentes bacterium]|nr:Gfo/Idh/MocA family oxidoreductase [Candidatus Hydrogenedentota bacterium]